MKRLIFFVFVFSFITGITCGQIQTKVDERFELTSIAFMLAGAPEYNQCGVRSYKQDIQNQFEKYKSDNSIKYMRELNQAHGIGYNAITNVADLLQIKNGIISLQPQYDMSDVFERDSRWNESLLTEFITMLNRFYDKSNFQKFYKNHQKLYKVAEERMDTLLARANTDWFENFFGRSLDGFSPEVYISLVNGASNYAMGNNSVLIGVFDDAEGLPNPSNYNTLPVLIHEWGHHFTNQIVFEYWTQMRDAAELIYPYVESAMNQAGYAGAETMTIEWLNNLFTIMYYRETTPEMVPMTTALIMQKGFIWIDRSVCFMDNFYTYRDRYPNIKDFMPQLIAFFNYTASQFDIVYREYKNSCPFITNIYPAYGTDITNFDEIVITFSEPMLGTWGFQSAEEDENIKNLREIIKAIQWSNDNMQAHILLDKTKMESDCRYGVRLYPSGFCSARYFPLDEKCINLQFNTIRK